MYHGQGYVLWEGKWIIIALYRLRLCGTVSGSLCWCLFLGHRRVQGCHRKWKVETLIAWTWTTPITLSLGYSLMPTPPEVLRESLERHNAAFENLLRLIPPKYYIVNDNPEASSCPSMTLWIEWWHYIRTIQNIRRTRKNRRHRSRRSRKPLKKPGKLR